MTVRYHQRFGTLVPDYVCQREGIENAKRICQTMPGRDIDAQISELLIERMTPAVVEISLAVQREIQARWQEADKLRYQQVERARYEAELAQRRCMQVDPSHRVWSKKSAEL